MVWASDGTVLSVSSTSKYNSSRIPSRIHASKSFNSIERLLTQAPHSKQGRLGDQKAELPSIYYEESEPSQSTLPDIVTADQYVFLTISMF
jgi:hypothetical protein